MAEVLGKQLTEVKVLISCPSDCEPYKNVVLRTVAILDDFCERLLHITLKPVYYRDNLASGVSDSAQGVIDDQLKDGFDIYVGLFWSKVGTPTKTHGSGTLEELDMAVLNAANGRTVGVHVYFGDEDLPKSLWPSSNLPAIALLKEQIGDKGIFYKSFASEHQLQSNVGVDLSHDLEKLIQRGIGSGASSTSKEQRQMSAEAYAASITAGFTRLGELTRVVSASMNVFSTGINSRTEEIARVGRMKKAFARKPALTSVYSRVVKDVELMNREFQSYLIEAPEVSRKSMLEIELLLDLFKDQRRHLFDLYFRAPLLALRDNTSYALKSFSGFRHAMVTLPSSVTTLVEPKTTLVHTMGEVESMLVQILLDLDRLVTMNSKS